MAVYAIHMEQPGFIFIINYKVMYSSLYDILPNHFPKAKFCTKKQAENYHFSKFQKFAIVRNPYRRTVSTYFDKCQKTPAFDLKQENAQLQYCQAQLLNTLALVRDEIYTISAPANYFNTHDHPEKRAILDENFLLLQSMSFAEYVDCLTIILSQKTADGHFVEQCKVFDIPGQNPFYHRNRVFNSTKIVRLENIESGWRDICTDLGVEMHLRKANKTDHLRPQSHDFYTKKTQAAVGKLYHLDFKKLGYSLNLP